MIIRFVILIFFILSTNVYAFNMYDICTLTDVIDGDTIKLDCLERNNIVVRFLGYDAYETRKIKRAYKQATKENITIDDLIKKGKYEKDKLYNLLNGKPIGILLDSENTKDIYDRYLGIIYYFDNGIWINLNEELINRGN